MLTRLFSVFLLVLLPVTSLLAASDIRGSSDPDRLPRFPLSWIVGFSKQEIPEYRLATGPMKKLEGVIAPEQSRSVRGLLTRVTYRVPDSHKPAEVFQHYLSQLEQLQANILFRCSSRQCGSSNQWANNYFQVAELYGVDRTQFFVSAELGTVSLALYTVKRGNRRVYINLDLIAPVQQTAASLKAELDRVGFSWIADLNELSPLSDYLQQSDDQRVLISGYSLGSREQSLEQLIAESEQLAQAVAEQLIAQGVDPQRLRVTGVGPALPVADPEQQKGVWVQHF